MSSTNNYNIIQGSTFVATQTVTDTNGDALDLTGASITTTIIDRNATEVVQVVTDSFSAPLTGTYTITIPAATTATLDIGCYELQGIVTLEDTTVFGLEISYINVNYAANQ